MRDGGEKVGRGRDFGSDFQNFLRIMFLISGRISPGSCVWSDFRNLLVRVSGRKNWGFW